MRSSTAIQPLSSATDDSLSAYLREISRYPLLERDTEVALAARAHLGDEDALRQLVCANLRFVVSVAKKYRHMGLSLSDLVNEGNIGLMRAAEKFDADKGVRFITYAAWWIRQSMLGALATQGHAVRVPANRAGAVRRLHRTARALRQELGREPTRRELAAESGVSEKEIDFSMPITSAYISLDAPVGVDRESSLMDFLQGESGDAAEEELEASSRMEWIREALDGLREREARVLRMHFGFTGGEAMTLEEIGSSMGITRERVRQIRDKALSRIRKLPTASQVAPRRAMRSLDGWVGQSEHWRVLSR